MESHRALQLKMLCDLVKTTSRPTPGVVVAVRLQRLAPTSARFVEQGAGLHEVFVQAGRLCGAHFPRLPFFRCG
jgi:hypothetical protein